MKDLTSRGLLSVEEMSALFEGRLRVCLPGGSFKMVRRNYSSKWGCHVYEKKLLVSSVIYLQPEGHILPLNPVPSKRMDATLPRGCQAN